MLCPVRIVGAFQLCIIFMYLPPKALQRGRAAVSNCNSSEACKPGVVLSTYSRKHLTSTRSHLVFSPAFAIIRHEKLDKSASLNFALKSGQVALFYAGLF